MAEMTESAPTLSPREAARLLPGAVSPDEIAALCRRFPELGAVRVGRRWRIPRRALPRIARELAGHARGEQWRPDQDRRGRA